MKSNKKLLLFPRTTFYDLIISDVFMTFYDMTPRQYMRHMLWPNVCLSQAGILSKWLNGSSWFLAQRLSSANYGRSME